MTKLFILLTGYLLFGQPTYSVAQKNVQLSNEVLLERCCEKIMKVGPCLAFTGDRHGKMRFRLLGIYSHGPVLFFMLRLNNRSPLDYDIEDIRFFMIQRGSANASEGELITDRGQPGDGRQPRLKRALLPVYVYDSMVTVAGHRRATTIYGLPRFQLPAGARLLIVIRERIPANNLIPAQGRELRIQTGNFLLQRPRLI